MSSLVWRDFAGWCRLRLSKSLFWKGVIDVGTGRVDYDIQTEICLPLSLGLWDT